MSKENEPTEKDFRRFDEHAAHMISAARLCCKNGFVIPAMMLVYAGIDGMAWLYRDHERQNNGKDFRKWVEEFLIAHLTAETVTSDDFFIDQKVTSDDFWAARCALLHEQSSKSDLTRKGVARQFFYTGPIDHFFPSPSTGRWKKEPIFLLATSVIDRFEIGISEFRAFIKTSDRRDVILTRSTEWFNYTHPPNS